MYAELEMEIESGVTATLIEPKKYFGVVRNFDCKALSKDRNVGVSFVSSIVCDPRVINIDRYVDSSSTFVYLVQQAGVVIARDKCLNIDELRASGLIPDSSRVSLSIQRPLEAPNERDAVEFGLTSRRRADENFAPFWEHAL